MGSAASAGEVVYGHHYSLKRRRIAKRIYWREGYLLAETGRGRSDSLWQLAHLEERLGNHAMAFELMRRYEMTHDHIKLPEEWKKYFRI
jgi:hypothetical protein